MQRGHHAGWNKITDVSAILGYLLYNRRTGIAELLSGHHKNRFEIRLKVPIHQRHVELEFEIGERTQSADDRMGFLRDGKIHEQPVESGHRDILKISDALLRHLLALFRGEERIFADVFGNGHGDVIK